MPFCFLFARLLHPPGILCVPGSTVGLPECARGSESLLHTADDEHILRLSQNSEHLWCLWEVSGPEVEGVRVVSMCRVCEGCGCRA